MSNDPPLPLITSRFVACGATRYHYHLAGDPAASAIPLVLVHGLGMSGAYWRRLQPLLAAARLVYAPDLPGFGRSSRPPAPLDVPALAHALGEWLDAVGLPMTHLLGHSMGGPVVVAFAAAHPARVGRLVLVGSTAGVRGERAPRQALGLLRDAARESPSLLPVALAAYRQAGPRRILATEALVDGDDTVATVASLRMPVLVARGERDAVVSAAETRLLVDAAPGAAFAGIAGGAHAAHWGRAVELARAVEAFLTADESG